MSSNWSTGTNTIQEVDTNKNLTCQMFKVRKQGGGTEYLVRKSDVTLGTKSVNKNGTYTAASAGKYGFSQFSVNVRGGNGSADSHGKPTGGDIKPGGAGSAVVGTDPETGNDVAVGVDETGNLVQTPVPSGIKIVTQPTKTDYVYQEDMDYSGLVVKMINRDGTTFTDVEHPNGHLAVGELVLPVEKAPAGGSSDVDTSNSYYIPQTSSYAYNTFDDVARDFGVSTMSGVQHLTVASMTGGVRAFLVGSAGAGTVYVYTWANTNTVAYHRTLGPDMIVINSWYQYGDTGLYWNETSRVRDVPSSYSMFDTLEHALAAISGEPHDYGTVTIPVQWNNPYTGDTHQDTFQITSTSADGDAHTSTSSNGTEGSGGGGTF